MLGIGVGARFDKLEKGAEEKTKFHEIQWAKARGEVKAYRKSGKSGDAAQARVKADQHMAQFLNRKYHSLLYKKDQIPVTQNRYMKGNAIKSSARYHAAFGHPPPKGMSSGAMDRWVAGKSEKMPRAPKEPKARVNAPKPGSKEHFVNHMLAADKLWFQNKHQNAMKHENELDKHYKTGLGKSGRPEWREELSRPNSVAHYEGVWSKHFGGAK
jgi:hypothetical protein